MAALPSSMIRNWVNRAAGKTWRPSGFRAGSLKQAAATSKGEKRSLLAAKEAEGGTTIAATCQHSFEPPRNPTRWLLWTKLWNARGGQKGNVDERWRLRWDAGSFDRLGARYRSSRRQIRA